MHRDEGIYTFCAEAPFSSLGPKLSVMDQKTVEMCSLVRGVEDDEFYVPKMKTIQTVTNEKYKNQPLMGVLAIKNFKNFSLQYLNLITFFFKVGPPKIKNPGLWGWAPLNLPKYIKTYCGVITCPKWFHYLYTAGTLSIITYHQIDCPLVGWLTYCVKKR